MDKIKVLIIAGAMNVGGIENQLMHLLRQADKDQFQIDFTTTEEHPFYLDEMLSLGAKCIHIPKTGGRHFIRQFRALFQIMRREKYDIIHSHELFHSGLVLLTARLAGVKHRFVHAHNWSDGSSLSSKIQWERKLYNGIMRRLIQRNATEFLACSSLAGPYLFGDKVTKQNNYHLVYNSVDTSRFIDNYGRNETGEYVEDGWVNVLQVGRFTVVKNQLFTTKIAAELKRRGKNIRILCVGNDGNEYEQKVRTAIKEFGLENYMLLLGIRKDIDILMRKCKAFILPSKYEGMPLVMIEAQASGLQCIASDTFSREVDFGLGTVTWLSDSADCTKWADMLEKAILCPRPTRESVSDVVLSKGYDSKTFAKTLCELYHAAMES